MHFAVSSVPMQHGYLACIHTDQSHHSTRFCCELSLSMCILHLCQKAIRTACQLRSGLQSRKQRAEQVQASYDNMVSIADRFKGIIGELELVAKAALLEMMLSRTGHQQFRWVGLQRSKWEASLRNLKL